MRVCRLAYRPRKWFPLWAAVLLAAPATARAQGPRLFYEGDGEGTAVVLVGDDPQIRSRMLRIEALRAEDGERLWVRRLPGKYVAAAASLGVVYVLRQDLGASGERESWVAAFSAETGEAVAAERRLAGSVSPVVTPAGDASAVPRRRGSELSESVDPATGEDHGP